MEPLGRGGVVKSFVIVLFSFFILSHAEAHREANCETAYGRTACGFHCESGYGDVKCAATPYGACGSGYGVVKCWDPARPYRHARAECMSGYGTVACGYNCASGYGQVKCANTPFAICTASYGEVKCIRFGETK